MRRCFGLFVLACSISTAHAMQDPQPAAPAAPAAQAPPAEPKAAGAQAEPGVPPVKGSAFSAEQLEQIVAPIALYPDSLVAQILMAATYPLEIVEAARWSAKNASVKGDALESALQKQTWDPSVKSVCGFPDVLKRMNDSLDWTQDLGDAFLGQKEELMKCIQTMRTKAYEAGNLKSSKEQTVTVQEDKIIVIQAADPEVIYVPTYYPSSVYGSWGYPYWHYPPMYPPYPTGGLLFGFTVGVIWGGCWGNCNWGGNDVDIDINNYNKFVDRTEVDARRNDVKNKAGSNGRFNHNPEHRKGVGYQQGKVAEKYGAKPGQSRVSKDQARGYGDRATAKTSGPAADRAAAGTRDAPGSRAGAGQPAAAQRPSTAPAVRPATGAATRTPSASPSTRPTASTGQRSSSYTGSRSPSMDRASSTRGSASRGSAGSRSAGASRGGRGGGRR